MFILWKHRILPPICCLFNVARKSYITDENDTGKDILFLIFARNIEISWIDRLELTGRTAFDLLHRCTIAWSVQNDFHRSPIFLTDK